MGTALIHVDKREDRKVDRRTDERKDMTNLTVSFLNHANLPTNQNALKLHILLPDKGHVIHYLLRIEILKPLRNHIWAKTAIIKIRKWD
jgi:hypothetical protein